jgi:hypothetical protein
MDSIPAHRDNSSWDYRILLFLSHHICSKEVIGERDKYFEFHDGDFVLRLRTGNGDVVALSRNVSGVDQFIDKNGNGRFIKHSADRVNGTASVVCHYDYHKRDGHRSFISGVESFRSTNFNEANVSVNDNDNNSSIDIMFELNKWRIVDSGEAEEQFFRDLIRNGLVIYRHNFEKESIDEAMSAFSNRLFCKIYASRSDYIPKISTGESIDPALSSFKSTCS